VKMKKLGMSKIPCGHKRAYYHIIIIIIIRVHSHNQPETRPKSNLNHDPNLNLTIY